jgi:hypothetical protein
MNARARQLRAYDVVARQPNGLPARGQVVSAYDRARRTGTDRRASVAAALCAALAGGITLARRRAVRHARAAAESQPGR